MGGAADDKRMPESGCAAASDRTHCRAPRANRRASQLPRAPHAPPRKRACRSAPAAEVWAEVVQLRQQVTEQDEQLEQSAKVIRYLQARGRGPGGVGVGRGGAQQVTGVRAEDGAGGRVRMMAAARRAPAAPMAAASTGWTPPAGAAAWLPVGGRQRLW